MGWLLPALALLLAPDAAVPEAPPPAKVASGPPPVAAMECAPEKPRIGDLLRCTVTIRHRQDVSVTSLTAPAGATAEPGGPARPAEGGLETVRAFTVQIISMKDLRLDGVTVVWQEASGGEGKLPIPPQRLKIASVIGNQTDAKFRTFDEPQGDADAFWAAHGPLPHLVTNWPLIIALIVLGGLGVGVGVGWVVRRWLESRRREPAPYVDPRPAHVIALEQLHRLAAEGLLEAGQIKAYYFRMSEIVRDYLERRFGFPAPEMTSDEIRARLAGLPIATEARLSLDDFLSETDLVKFADFSPSDAAVASLMPAARGLVELTRAREEVPAAAEAVGKGAHN